MITINSEIVSKRSTFIPVTIFDCEKEKAGLLLLAHGFKADRYEGGRFTSVAKILANYGISSICMGFPGCDESKEDFLNYSLTNCLNDIESCHSYMMSHYNIDLNRIGMIGYSMGGRLTSLYIQNHPEIKTIGLWAGATYDGFENEMFLGSPVDYLKKNAKEKGYCDYLNGFDHTNIQLSKELIDDMERYIPSVGLKNFKGNCIVVHGTNDDMVNIASAYQDIELLNMCNYKRLVIIQNANHGFGLWDNHTEQSERLVRETSDFFKEYL